MPFSHIIPLFRCTHWGPERWNNCCRSTQRVNQNVRKIICVSALAFWGQGENDKITCQWGFVLKTRILDRFCSFPYSHDRPWGFGITCWFAETTFCPFTKASWSRITLNIFHLQCFSSVKAIPFFLKEFLWIFNTHKTQQTFTKDINWFKKKYLAQSKY